MKLTCPACGREATRVRAAFGDETAAYCQNCGWNAALAAAKLRSSASVAQGVAIFGLLLALLGWYRSGLRAGLLLACGFVLLPLTMAWLTRARASRVERIPGQSASATRTLPSAGHLVATDTAEKTLKYQQRPRGPRLTWRGRLYSAGVAAVSILLILFACLIYRDDSQALFSPKGLLILGGFGWYAWLCGAFFVSRWKEFKLLTDGAFARGVVFVQQDLTRSMPRITYTFKDSMGTPFQKRVIDFTHGLFEGMPVSVFYDEREPSRNMALESSLFRLD